MPIFLVLGVLSMILFWYEGDPLIGFSQLFIDHLNSQTLISIPFFVMAATFMQRGGIAKALVDCAYSWVGGARGGLALVCVLATTVFAAISGSSVATAMAMGTILVPAMLEKNGIEISVFVFRFDSSMLASAEHLQDRLEKSRS